MNKEYILLNNGIENKEDVVLRFGYVSVLYDKESNEITVCFDPLDAPWNTLDDSYDINGHVIGEVFLRDLAISYPDLYETIFPDCELGGCYFNYQLDEEPNAVIQALRLVDYITTEWKPNIEDIKVMCQIFKSRIESILRKCNS